MTRVIELTDQNLGGKAIDVSQKLPGTYRTVFAELRETAVACTVRAWAAVAPFDTMDQLKTRGYRWMPVDRDPPNRPLEAIRVN